MGRWTFVGVGVVVLAVVFCLHPAGWAEERYTVKAGDSLSGIAKSFGVTVDALKRANRLEGDGLKVRQVIAVPVSGPDSGPPSRPAAGERRLERAGKRFPAETESYVVQPGESLSVISKRTGLSVDEIKRVNQLRSSNLKAGQRLLLPRQKIEAEEELEEGADPGEAATEASSDGNGSRTESFDTLGKWNGPEERSLLIKVAKTFLGVPYRLGGSTLRGIDCSAFVKKIYEIFDIYLPRTSWEQFKTGKPVERDALEEGDLVFFKVRRANGMHVGIYIGNRQFVHASNHEKEVKVDTLDTPYFNTRFVKGVRVKELVRES